MAVLCSGWTSITSLIKRIVSRDVKVDLPSNLRNELMRGARTAGIVYGKVCVIWLMHLISRYLYSFVMAALGPWSSILQALWISYSRKAMISLMFLGLTSIVVNSRIFWLISKETA